MEKLQIGSKVKIDTMYGGGSGYVKEIVGSFVIVKTTSNKTRGKPTPQTCLLQGRPTQPEADQPPLWPLRANLIHHHHQ